MDDIRMISKLKFQGFPLDMKPPTGWLISSLDEIADIVQSGFASGKHNRNEEGIPHLRPMNVNPDGEIDLMDIRYIDPKINSLRLGQGDILFNNTNSQLWVGKTALIRTGDDLAFFNHMTRVKVKPLLINAEFIAKQLNFLRTSGYFQIHCKKHVNQASIAGEILRNEVPILVPPTNEQRRIVARIEELQARSRRAREALEVIPDLLDQLRQSILAAAFRGDLTKKWRERHPTVEPASELLKRIRTERRKRWEDAELEKLKAKGLSDDNLQEAFANRRKQYKEPVHVDTTNLPEIPEGWCWASIEELSKNLQYGSSLKSSKAGRIPVLRMGNLQNGKVDWSDLVYTSDDNEIGKYSLTPNTVLFNRTNSPELVGKTAIYRGEQEAVFAGYLIKINHMPQIHPGYLNIMLNTPFIRQLCASVKSDAVSQSNINASKLAMFPIPFCSWEEQSVIVAIVESAVSTMQKESDLTSNLFSLLQNFDQSILFKAFRGELVPQDPNDEPASILLERIRQEKARAVTEPKVKDKRKGKKNAA